MRLFSISARFNDWQVQAVFFFFYCSQSILKGPHVTENILCPGGVTVLPAHPAVVQHLEFRKLSLELLG